MSTAAAAWADALASWAIPPEILADAPQNPWACPVGLFVRAAEEAAGLNTPSFQRALEGIPVGGTVVDVGCGAGAASLRLAPPASILIGVDESDPMLGAFAERVGALGIAHREIKGRWPDVAPAVPAADIVVCHHVLYNVPDIEPFITALTAHARRRVVVEITAEHPRAWMNPLWMAFHGIERPTRPTASYAYAVLADLGIDAHVERWERPMTQVPHHEEVAMARVALCLPAERDPDVARALSEHPPPSAREIVTLWWYAD